MREVEVLVDSREPDVMLDILDDNEQVADWWQVELETGDYVVEGDVVFERKTPGDFIGSMKNQRLEDQISRMYDEYGAENSFVLVSGSLENFDVIKHSQMSSKAVRGFVGSISARWQMVPMFCETEVHLIDMVCRIGRKRIENTERVIRGPSSSPTRKDDSYYMKALLSLDGVGKETAKNVASEFESLPQLVDASESELQKISGIGGKKAESIRKQLNSAHDLSE